LARRDGFSRVLQQRANTVDWFAVYWEESKSSHARLGVTVSKRIVPTAVGRNRIKRMVRERFRNVAHRGLARDIVIRLRRRLSKAEQPAARKVLDGIMKNILSAEA
jgi:ribonuclease P protein component